MKIGVVVSVLGMLMILLFTGCSSKHPTKNSQLECKKLNHKYYMEHRL